MIHRKLEKQIQEDLFKGKAIILLGARQVGKTTLLTSIFGTQKNTLWLNADEYDVRELFSKMTSTRLKAILGENKILIIDEAQRIDEMGLRMKLITDQLPNVQLLVTGSSSFELKNKINEPLTGRKWEYHMFPLSFGEMVGHHGLLEEKRLIPHRLIYGYYPDVVTNPGREKDILRLLSDSYLYKDVLMLDQIKKPEKLTVLLQALAFQVGSQVSYSELANLSGLSSKTVEKYIDILEKAYVIFRLGSFSRNLRNELKFSKKIYFYDNGIRNALIARFDQPESRDDLGALWENFLVSERMKQNHYSGKWVNSWFWRTKEQKEIDLIEEGNGKIQAFEFKWNPAARIKIPKSFLSAYPHSKVTVIDQDNFDEFLLN